VEWKSLFAIFGGFATRSLRTGVEIDHLADTGGDSTQQILAVYANIAIRPCWSAFGRVDTYNPDIHRDRFRDGQIYIIVGLNYAATQRFHVAPNLRVRNSKTSSFENVRLASINVNMEFRY